MIEMRKRRFLDAAISEFLVLPDLAITTPILYHDICRRSVKTVLTIYCSRRRLVERDANGYTSILTMGNGIAGTLQTMQK
jgi:hypothetical protein